MQAHSAGEGLGSSFLVRLPLIAEETWPDVSSQYELPGKDFSSQSGIRIIAVDDDPDSCAFVRQLIEDRGGNVTTATSAGEALALLELEKFDLLVADIGMPVMDGYELIRKVRALSPEAGGLLPAIALTAFAGHEDRQRVLREGYQLHVSKPVEADELVTAIVTSVTRQP